MRIVPAVKEDASLIADVVMTAVGDEITKEFAGTHPVEDVKKLFTLLAEFENSQYSYRNTLKAVDSDGVPMGFIVGYDGARLKELREAFISAAKDILGYELVGKLHDETGPGEYYLDSLAVFSRYRKRGVARALIAAASEKAKTIGKPAGLLCAKDNPNARRLYESIGFRKVGETPFAGELMDHYIC